MYVVVIREQNDELNVVGPFWHKNAAEEFVNESLAPEPVSTIESVTDREKFSHDKR